jgi:hypothetical protein
VAVSRLLGFREVEKAFLRFVDMIDCRWSGVAACCRPESKVSFGFVGNFNKIRVLQRRAGGPGGVGHRRLELVLTCCRRDARTKLSNGLPEDSILFRRTPS